MTIAKCLIIGTLVALMAAPLPAQQQKAQLKPDLPVCGPNGCPPPPGSGYASIPTPALSTSVLNVAQQKFTTLANETQVGTIHATTIAGAATALQTLFQNMHDTGYTAQLQAWAVANEALWTSPNPSSAVLTAGYNALKGTGVTLTYSQFTQMILGQPYTAREAFVTQLNAIGLEGIHTQIISAMDAWAASARDVESKGHTYVLAVSKVPWISLSGAYIAVVGLSLAVATIGTGGLAPVVLGLISVGLSAGALWCAC